MPVVLVFAVSISFQSASFMVTKITLGQAFDIVTVISDCGEASTDQLVGEVIETFPTGFSQICVVIGW